MSRIKKPAEGELPEGLVAEVLSGLTSSPDFEPTLKRRAAMKRSLLARIPSADTADAALGAPGTRIVRAAEGNWITFAPNVAMKVLHDDGETRTWLARFEPGGRVPAHLQSGDEEAYVLEGWCFVDQHIMRKGDYQLIPKGTRHGEIVSPEGCMVFVRSHSANRSAAELAGAV